MSFSLFSKKFGAFLSKQTVTPRPPVPLRRSMSATKNTINRRDLAAIIAEEHELTIAQSERIVKSVFDTIVDVRTQLCFNDISLESKNDTH